MGRWIPVLVAVFCCVSSLQSKWHSCSSYS